MITMLAHNGQMHDSYTSDLEDLVSLIGGHQARMMDAAVLKALGDAGFPLPDLRWPREQIEGHLRLHLDKPFSVTLPSGNVWTFIP